MQDPGKANINKKTMLLLAALILVTCAAVFCQYIFGDRILAFLENDIGSDTAQQYVSQYSLIIRKIASGDFSFWDATNGFGVNLYTYTLTNPFIMLLYLVGTLVGRPQFLYLLVYLYILEILVTGLCGYLYLSEFSFSEYAKLIASFMFAFNSYLIIWGQHYQFGAYCAVTAVVARTLERYIRGRSPWWSVTLAAFLAIWTSPYTGYMIMIFAAVYVIVRLLMTEKFRFGRFLGRGFKIAGMLLLGVGLAGCVLLPFAYDIFCVSSRLSTSRSLYRRVFGERYDMRYYKTQLSRFVLSSGDGISTMMRYHNYYFAPCLHFSMLFVPYSVQYAVSIPKMKTTLKSKVWHYLLLVCFLISVLTPPVSVIMNGFAYPAFRYYFMYMVYFALIATKMTDEITSGGNGVGLLYIPVLTFMLWRLVLFYIGTWGTPVKIFPIEMVLAAAMCAILFLFRHWSRREKKMEADAAAESSPAPQYARAKKVCRVLLPVTLILSIALDVFGTFDAEYVVSVDPPISSRGALVKEGPYFRELYYSDMAEAVRWVKAQDPEYFRMEKLDHLTFASDALVQDYRGVSFYNSIASGRIQDYIDTYWPELPYYDDNHYFILSGVENHAQTELAGVKYLLVKDENMTGTAEGDEIGHASPAKLSRSQIVEKGETVIPDGYTEIHRIGDVHIFRDENVENIASFYAADQVETVESGEISVAYDSRDTFSEIHIDGTQPDDTVTGTVTASKDGYLYISVPNEIGWSAYLDGEETEMVLANKAFTAVLVPRGGHTFTLKYTCPGVREGLIISAGSLFLFIAFLIMLRKKRRGAE